MQAERREHAWIIRSAVVFMLSGVSIGCADPTRPIAATVFTDARSTQDSTCAIPTIRGRSPDTPGIYAPIELGVATGDTARLSRLWPSGSAAVEASSTAWRVEDTAVARVEGDLVIPLSPGRTRVIGSIAGRAVCVGLTALASGATLSALTVDRTPIPLSNGSSARVEATVSFSNGFSVRVHEAATWSSLDPAVADVSSSAWITPRLDGAARIVASMGRFADTATVVVNSLQYKSLQPRRAEDFASAIGVNVHLSYFDLVYGTGYRSIILPRLKELGVRHLRDGGTWLPNVDWMNAVYSRWREVGDSTGAQFTVIMSPRRTSTGPGTNYGDMSHVFELGSRIGVNHIAAWEGVNEHDLSGRSTFASEVRTLQQALFAVVKNDPYMSTHHLVVGPSLANVSASSQVGSLSAYMDEGAIHPYDGGQVPTTNLSAHVTGIRGVTGTRALQATEVGYHTSTISTNPWHFAVSELAQAKYTVREFLEEFNAGITRSFAYELIDEGVTPDDMEHHFGLLRNDGSRKPAFVAVRNLLALLGDRGAPTFATRALRVAFTGDTAGVHRLLVQKNDGRRYLVLWQNTPSYDRLTQKDVLASLKAVTVNFESPMSTATVYAPVYGSTAIATYSNVQTMPLAISDHPIVIELSK